jgi:hypothetical protein
MRAGDQNRHQQLGKPGEELPQRIAIAGLEHRETR